MNAKVEKNLMNGVNRRLNCDVANVDKAVQAAQGQIEAIHRLESRGSWQSCRKSSRRPRGCGWSTQSCP